ncbi:hypothetical protein [Chitinophaga silvisoli]|uniref:DUF4465 domain-containing protein n=1 Tax=Chitinophaga silvisoli TaxID=2291814 RepID=A0A3E1P2W9_9BACT|nr:hypothetical protein [Chitinophaga silvisoli]RFM34546.1 hypothetical protein DXN04_14840 [Chitinophaga silvisoli]
MKTLRFSAALLVAGTIALFSSCQKDDVTAPNSGLTVGGGLAVVVPDGGSINLSVAGPYASKTKGTVSRSGSVYTVSNFAQGTVTAPADSTQWSTVASTYYFNLSTNVGGDSVNATTVSYDLRFTGSANGDIYAYSGAYTLNYQDSAFATAKGVTTLAAPGGKLGTNRIYMGTVLISSSIGWYDYNITSHIVTAYQPRTLILKDRITGKPVWKVSITSIYSNSTPNAGSSATNYPYYNFQYQAL